MSSLNLQLPETVYDAIAVVAAESGRSVEAVAVESLVSYFTESDDVPDSFFTPAILAEIDAAREEADLGGGISMDEMRKELAEQSRAWRASHPA